MSADNIRPIIAFIADSANAEHLSKFLPEAVLSAATRVSELRAELDRAASSIAELKTEIAAAKAALDAELATKLTETTRAAELATKLAAVEARIPSRPVITGTMPGECFMYLAGIGYVLVANKLIQTMFQLNAFGEVSVIRGIEIPTGPTTYTENQVVSTPAKSNPRVFTIDFVPCDTYKRIGRLTIKSATKTTVYSYERNGDYAKRSTHSDKITKTLFDNGKAVRKTTKVNNVKTIKRFGCENPTVKVRLHLNITRETYGDDVVYVLKNDDYHIEFTPGSDEIEVLSGPEVTGYMSVSGSKYKFHYGKRCEVYALKNGRLTYIETRE